jgi:outer membrane receptor protein involved in Fe transport
MRDPIVRRTLLFPADNPPSQLSGIDVSPLPQTPAQAAQGVVEVATALDSRAVKAFVNDGASRYYGIESVARYSLAAQWVVEANYAYMVGRDLNPNRNTRRLPPQAGTLSVRYAPNTRKPWIEISLTATGEQDRLSGGDIDDERMGASRSRRDIAAFFYGSRVAPYLENAVFLPTGETLQQIQNRVLPGVADSTRVPLYTSTAGWYTLNFRGGLPLSERWNLTGALENALDRNYRVHGSGLDAPGRSAYLGITYRF